MVVEDAVMVDDEDDDEDDGVIVAPPPAILRDYIGPAPASRATSGGLARARVEDILSPAPIEPDPMLTLDDLIFSSTVDGDDPDLLQFSAADAATTMFTPSGGDEATSAALGVYGPYGSRSGRSRLGDYSGATGLQETGYADGGRYLSRAYMGSGGAGYPTPYSQPFQSALPRSASLQCEPSYLDGLLEYLPPPHSTAAEAVAAAAAYNDFRNNNDDDDRNDARFAYGPSDGAPYYSAAISSSAVRNFRRTSDSIIDSVVYRSGYGGDTFARDWDLLGHRAPMLTPSSVAVGTVPSGEVDEEDRGRDVLMMMRDDEFRPQSPSGRIHDVQEKVVGDGGGCYTLMDNSGEAFFISSGVLVVGGFCHRFQETIAVKFFLSGFQTF